MLRNGGLVLHSRVEQTIFGQVSDHVALRMLRRVNDHSLLIGVEIDLDHNLALEQAVVDHGAEHLLVAEPLVDNTYNHASTLVQSLVSLRDGWIGLLLLIHDPQAPQVLAEAVAINCHDGAGLFECQPALAPLVYDLCTEEVGSFWTMR